MIAKLRKAWAFARKYWKALAAGLSVLLVLVYTALSKRHRRQAVELKRQAHMAEGAKDEQIKSARKNQHLAEAHGDKADAHQKNAQAVIKRLKAKEGRMGVAEAEELAERIAGRQ